MEQTTQWHWKKLIYCHVAIFLLLFTFFWSPTREYWQILDTSFFRWINESLRDNPSFQVFWALANHKKADWLEDVCIFLFFFFWIRSLPSSQKTRATAQFLFCIVYATFTILLVNHLVFRNLVEVFRASPTLALDDVVRLSKKIRWLSIKDSSPKCFPADHATTALLFASLYSFFAERKKAIFAWLYAAFLCMPRMITGAHWLSDVIVGSGSIALLFLSWGLYTPLHVYMTNKLEKLVFFFRKKQTV